MEGIIYKVVIDRLSDEEMDLLADCEVTRQFSNTSWVQSPYDFHMGVHDKGGCCETCSCFWKECVGGVGLINLPIPFYFGLNGKIISNVVNKICKSCGLFYDYPIGVSNPCGKFVVCKCQISLRYHIQENEFEFIDKNFGVVSVTKMKEIILQALKKSFGTEWATGTCHKLLNSSLLVTPVFTRPYLIKGNQYLHNDITAIYNAIVKECKNNNRLYEKIEMLQTQKKKVALPNSSKIPQSLQDRIQGKEGLINSNINGKRCNHSGMAKITG